MYHSRYTHIFDKLHANNYKNIIYFVFQFFFWKKMIVYYLLIQTYICAYISYTILYDTILFNVALCWIVCLA